MAQWLNHQLTICQNSSEFPPCSLKSIEPESSLLWWHRSRKLRLKGFPRSFRGSGFSAVFEREDGMVLFGWYTEARVDDRDGGPIAVDEYLLL